MKKVWTDNVLKGRFFICQQICLIWKNNITFITANMGVDVDLVGKTCGAGSDEKQGDVSVRDEAH